MKVLVIGDGGREHAIIWKISQSPKVSKIYCAPGNAGISKLAECVSIKSTDIESLKFFVQNHNIDLTIVGPELPLVCGIVDEFKKIGLRIFGPERAAALLEGSKIFSKRVMKTLNIPTSDFLLFDDMKIAKRMIEFMDQPLVIKADGLASGKGVFVCKGKEDALEAVDKIMVQRIFGDAGRFIVVEKVLEGIEVSFMAFTDGKSIVPMPMVFDRKTLYKNSGPNTGGMGATGPFIKENFKDEVMNKILIPLINGLSNQGIKYSGVIYVGLKSNDICASFDCNPKVLEFNVRFGDPEGQILMMLLETDLIDIIEAIEQERLNEIEIKWKDDHVKTVALVSKGYPNEYKVGFEIDGLDREYPTKRFPNTRIFHGGTRFDGDKIVTNGGRVVYVTTTGENRHTENKLVIDDINFEGKYYREDI
jgi:phosphoribosylamine--glycine ligase